MARYDVSRQPDTQPGRKDCKDSAATAQSRRADVLE